MKTGFLAELLKLDWREFDETDRKVFSGCETDSPRIAETDEGVYIVDGNRLQFIKYDENSEFQMWNLEPVYF